MRERYGLWGLWEVVNVDDPDAGRQFDAEGADVLHAAQRFISDLWRNQVGVISTELGDSAPYNMRVETEWLDENGDYVSVSYLLRPYLGHDGQQLWREVPHEWVEEYNDLIAQSTQQKGFVQ